jgi:hypothetical protein
VVIVLGIVGHLKHKSVVKQVAVGFDVVTLLLTYFLMLFNTRGATYQICDAYSDICMEDNKDAVGTVRSRQNTNIEDWEAIMYMIGLCAMIVAEALWGFFLIKTRQAAVAPVNSKTNAREA